MRRVLLALAVLVVLPASTEAAPPWSAPRDVSGPHTFVDGLWAGGGLIGWRSEDGEAGAPAGRSGDPVFFGERARRGGDRAAGRLEPRPALGAAGGDPLRRRASARRGASSSTRGSRRPRWPATRAATSRSPGSRTAASPRSRLRRAAPGGPRVREADPARRRPRARRVGRGRLARRRARGVEHGRQGPHAASSAAGTGSAAPRRCGPSPAWGAELRPAVASSGRAYVAWASQAPVRRRRQRTGLLRGRDAPRRRRALPPRAAARPAPRRPPRRPPRPRAHRPRQRARGVGLRPRARGGDRRGRPLRRAARPVRARRALDDDITRLGGSTPPRPRRARGW